MPMTARSFTSRRAALLAATLLLPVRTVSADDIRVMTSGSFTAAYFELTPQCERVTRDTFVTVTTTIGTGPAYIPTRLQRGEAADVVIVDDATLLQMIKDGLVRSDSRVDLARSSIGMAVRAGAPRPDISSVEALKRTLLQAKSIAYSASVSGRYLTTELFPRLGIADEVMHKARRIEGERVGTVVARGDADIGFQQISELLPIPGIDFVGPLPPEVQRTTVFSAGIVTASRNANGARALIACLAGPEATGAVTKSGLEPMMHAEERR